MGFFIGKQGEYIKRIQAEDASNPTAFYLSAFCCTGPGCLSRHRRVPPWP